MFFILLFNDFKIIFVWDLEHVKIQKVSLLLFLLCYLLTSHDIVEQFPLINAFAVLEEIEEYHFIKFETFALVNGETEHVAHESWQLSLTFLVSHDNDSITAELRLLYTTLILLLVGLFLFMTLII